MKLKDIVMKKSLLSLKLLIGLYLVVATLFLIGAVAGDQDDFSKTMCVSVFSFIWAYFHHKVRSGLQQEKYWAWIASINLFIMTIPSFLFPIGILGLRGVLKKETRRTFARNDLAEAC